MCAYYVYYVHIMYVCTHMYTYICTGVCIYVYTRTYFLGLAFGHTVINTPMYGTRVPEFNPRF